MQDIVVCGWYTPDYQPWADKFLSNVKNHGLPHDVVKIEQLTGSWEQKTRAKADQVLKAMDRHHDKTIFFLDVDCEVRNPGKLLELKSRRCDVGFYIRTRFRKAGGVKWGVRSGTLLIQPTDKARAFVEAWRDLNASAPAYSHDQDTLMVAMGRVPGCAFSVLDLRYCATTGDGLSDPWILHSSASENTPKASKWKKLVRRWLDQAKVESPRRPRHAHDSDI